jgi:cytochrome c oxidase subunit 4
MKTETRTVQQTRVQVHGQPHPTPRTFIVVGGVLAVITAIEFLILYVKGMSSIVMLLLAALSVAKFFLVAAYFMHLRFDPRLLAGIFAVGVTLAVLITVAVRYINLA